MLAGESSEEGGTAREAPGSIAQVQLQHSGTRDPPGTCLKVPLAIVGRAVKAGNAGGLNWPAAGRINGSHSFRRTMTMIMRDRLRVPTAASTLVDAIMIWPERWGRFHLAAATIRPGFRSLSHSPHDWCFPEHGGPPQTLGRWTEMAG